MSYQEQFEREEWENIARSDHRSFAYGESAEQVAAPNGELATDRQVSYMEALRDGKDLSSLEPKQIAWLRDADFTQVPKRRASDVIGKMKDLPWMPRDAAHDDSVKNGRYAIPKDDGTLMFYSVKQGKSVTFVDVWASDARWPVKNSQERNRILEAIKSDPDAGPRFGREIGACYVCGRTLTDETSRQLGIGPVCRGGGGGHD